MSHTLYHNDALEIVKQIPDKSIDFILTEPPYDQVTDRFANGISFNDLWTEFNRIIKHNRMIAIISNQPFSSRLITSNINKYQYSWYWKHDRKLNIDFPKPVNILEEISIFGGHYLNKDQRIITNILEYEYDIPKQQSLFGLYQKPISLCKRLIELYTSEGETVLDCFAGSGSVGIAAEQLNRNSILVEKDLETYNKMIQEINK